MTVCAKEDWGWADPNDGGWRPYALPNGGSKSVLLEWCRCGKKRRGPRGGVCGECTGAIPRAKPKEPR